MLVTLRVLGVNLVTELSVKLIQVHPSDSTKIDYN